MWKNPASCLSQIVSRYVSSVQLSGQIFDIRDGPVAVTVDVLQQTRRSHFRAEVVTGVRGESEVVVDERHEGQSHSQRLKLHFLFFRKNTSTSFTLTFYTHKIHTVMIILLGISD